MIAENIIMFIILLVLAYCMSDSFLGEFIIIIFALMNIDWSSSSITSIVTMQETWLFGVIALYGLGNLIQWIDDYRQTKPKKMED